MRLSDDDARAASIRTLSSADLALHLTEYSGAILQEQGTMVGELCGHLFFRVGRRLPTAAAGRCIYIVTVLLSCSPLRPLTRCCLACTCSFHAYTRTSCVCTSVYQVKCTPSDPRFSSKNGAKWYCTLAVRKNMFVFFVFVFPCFGTSGATGPVITYWQ